MIYNLFWTWEQAKIFYQLLHFIIFYYSLEKQSLESGTRVYVSNRKSSTYCSDFASCYIPPIHMALTSSTGGVLFQKEKSR